MEEIYKDGDNSSFPFGKLEASILNHPNEVMNISNLGYMSSNKSNEVTPSVQNRFNRRIALIKNNGLFINMDTSKEKGKSDNLTIAYHQKTSTSLNQKTYKWLLIYYHSQVHIYITIVFTLLGIFSVDSKLIFLNAQYEKAFTIYYLILICYFIIEMILHTLCELGYIVSFYAVIDLLCIAFMIIELEDCIKAIVKYFTIEFDGFESVYYDHNQLEKYVRLIRIFRMVHVVKLFYTTISIVNKIAQKRTIKKIEEFRQKRNERKKKLIEEKKNKRKMSNKSLKNPSFHNDGKHMDMMGIFQVSISPSEKNIEAVSSLKRRESKLQSSSRQFQLQSKFQISSESFKPLLKGQRINTVITSQTNQKIIMIIIIIYFANPLTDDMLFMCPYDLSFNIFARMINKIHSINDFLPEDKGAQLGYLFENLTLGKYSIINATYDDLVLYENATLKNEVFRCEEIGFSVLPPRKGLITFSLKIKCKIRSIVAIFRSIFTFLLLFFYSTSLSKDAQRMLLNPLEDMIRIVDVVSRDPVNSKLIEDLKKSCQTSIKTMKNKNHSSDFEIKIIQFAVIRISALLAIGFGEAGGEILKENIQSSEGLNPMLQGKKIEAIFGFCYIRHFTEINEVLQEKTMIFVNKISEIVHSSIDKFGGITNKNLGDCFLLVWKINNEHKQACMNGITNLNHSPVQQQHQTIIEDEKNCIQSDEALLAFLSIIKKINKTESIIAYRKNGELQERLGKNFKIQMGFGLHKGWGIEGAIGSFYKIDCSYLSPNVNIAARLETATNIYGVEILFSGEFYNTLSTFMKRICRNIDVVALKGCVTPVKLYTVDVNTNLHLGKPKDNNKKFNIRERRIKKLKLRNGYENEANKTIGEVYLSRSRGLRQLLYKTKSEAFLSFFDEGFNYYIDGDWDEAFINLKNALYLDKNDGPTKTLLSYIRKNNNKPPDDWDGFRKLEAKF